MSVGLYLDVHVPRPITRGLRKRGVEVITAQEDGTDRWSDPDLLDRAIELNKVLFSQDEDLLVEAARRQTSGITFNALIYAPQLALTTGQFIEQLELFGQGRRSRRLCQRSSILALTPLMNGSKLPMAYCNWNMNTTWPVLLALLLLAAPRADCRV